MRLKDRVALITGAATGIGRTCALTFAREGAKLLIADVNEKDARSVVDEINSNGGEAVFWKTDVRQRAENDAMVAACVEQFGRLDILFCNAGITVPKTLTETTDEDIDRVMDVNVKALAWAARAAVPIRLEQGKGNS
ncbi:MAG: SDR family NAD(P)-dependent oxidoreductase, partial [Rhodothermales bacterium]